MRQTIRQNLPFLVPYILFLTIAGVFLWRFPKGEAHLLINNHSRNILLDYFFSYSTHIGDGFAAAGLVLVLCFVKYRYSVLLGLSNIISSAITQTLKRTVFADQVRPAKYFEGISALKLIPWVENYSYNSFPSGHATVAFTTFFCMALIIENKTIKFLLFLAALLIGFSRVYLSQHFLNDVYAGSLIGMVTTLLIYQFVIESKNFRQMGWTEKSLLNK